MMIISFFRNYFQKNIQKYTLNKKDDKILNEINNHNQIIDKDLLKELTKRNNIYRLTFKKLIEFNDKLYDEMFLLISKDEIYQETDMKIILDDCIIDKLKQLDIVGYYNDEWKVLSKNGKEIPVIFGSFKDTTLKDYVEKIKEKIGDEDN